MTESNPPGVAFVAHCLLNQNSKTDGGARCPGIYSPLVDLLRERGWRIEQMPCPEHAFLGMHRFWLVKDQADTLAFRRHCRRQAKVVAGAIAVHVERGTDVVVIGVEGSPSMMFIRVPENKTSKNRMHLDLFAPDREAEAARLVELGATRGEDHDEYGVRWTVFTDPEGNEFCVATQDTTGNAS